MTSFSFYKISNAIQSYFAIKVKVDKEVVVFFFSSWCLMRRARTAAMLVGTFTAVLNSWSLHFTSLHLLISGRLILLYCLLPNMAYICSVLLNPNVLWNERHNPTSILHFIVFQFSFQVQIPTYFSSSSYLYDSYFIMLILFSKIR